MAPLVPRSQAINASDLRDRTAEAEAKLREMEADGTIDARELASRLAQLDQWLSEKLEAIKEVQLVN